MNVEIDLNCDTGESYGAYRLGDDDALLRRVSSANVACGFHAGDATVMRRTVRTCLAHGVRIGAHPGLPDLQGFGRRAMALSPDDVYDIALYQIGALQAIAAAEGGRVEHVKPHGALYHMAEADDSIAEALARAASRTGGLTLVGLSGGRLVAAGRAASVPVWEEAFADRAYRSDGALLPRSSPGAVLDSPSAAAEQALRLARDGEAIANDGQAVSLKVDTICIHGDGPHAAETADAIRAALAAAGIRIGRGTHGTT
ncbi:5-oxoprolinase subunit PxpA [Paenibacillus antri]|uniref:5-oxoprolinase subunit A n=1 Tax=Paenibacillus antri TaxID=2582848 RepID=A0A5R9GJB1_9BACL|nr:5-oxoprolinase subunit PxpA [Paenibacillus antri]TLS52963.1 5-oxoprolinase subunit PxpA [Paenibacillus antri]